MTNYALAEAAESATLAILDLREVLLNQSGDPEGEKRMIELSRNDIRRAQSKRASIA